MPITRNGVTFADAYLEAAAISDTRVAVLDALELYHPDAVERIRFVNDNEPLFATLEPAAPEDGGVEVEFLACPCRIVPADESDSASNPDTIIEVDNLSGRISDLLKLTRGSFVPWLCTARIYADTDTSAPLQDPPTVVELRAVEIDSTRARLVFNFGDAGNVGVPGLTFNRRQYPGLRR